MASGRRFCSRPFRDFEISGFDRPKGSAYLCCPSWLPTSIGNVLERTPGEVWNGPEARAIRASIHDGSFRYCSRMRCPHLETVTGPVQYLDDVTDPRLLMIIEEQPVELFEGPRTVTCSYDHSCNLACPTCRKHRIVETDAEAEILAIHEVLEASYLADARKVYITGSGDAFGSQYFNRWLRTMDIARMPDLERIHLHTNAQLWTPSMWERLPARVRRFIGSAEISIDAARAETYAVNRAPGSFERLLENLSFIQTLRRNGPLRHLKISMVVQDNNVEEMGEFVELGRRFEIDEVYFGQLVNWGTFTHEEFVARAVHRPEHPRHDVFVAMLRDPRLSDSRVFLGNLSPR